MFIATAITNQSKLCRSATEGAIYIALLRSCERKQTSIYKHFIPTGFICPRNLLKKQEVRPLLRRLHRFQKKHLDKAFSKRQEEDDSQTQIIRAAALQDRDRPDTSSFNLIIVDLQSKKQKIFEYKW